MLRAETIRTGGLAFPRTGLSWPLLIGAAAFLAFYTRPALLNDGDTYWHIATGRWILEHGAIPAADVFSHTLQGSPWTAHEWLSEVLLTSSFMIGGWVGVVSLAAAAIALALAMLSRFLLRHLEPIYMLVVVALCLGLFMQHLLARPHTLVAPVMVAWSIGLAQAREGGRTPRWCFALLMALWANMHASFLVGLALTGAFAIEAVLAASSSALKKQAASDWGIFLGISLLAALCTPFGVQGLLFSIEVSHMRYALSALNEWRSPDFQRFQSLELWLLIGGGAVLLRGIRLPPVRIAALLFLLHLALKHARHADLLALIAPVLVAAPFGAQWSACAKSAGSFLDRVFNVLIPRARPAAVIVVLALLAAFVMRAMNLDAVRPAASPTPEAALRAVQENHVEGAVLNAYEFGGYLIFSGVRPFIDGRADLYGDEFLRRFVDTVRSTDRDFLEKVLDSHAIQWTLLSPNLAAVAVLDRMPGWRRLYADGTAVVHVRNRRE